LKGAALGAALFFCLGAGAEPRVQRLVEQALKLQGRAKAPRQPLQSILLELADYHGEEEADFRGRTLPIGPWARRELALHYMKHGDFSTALTHFRELGKDYEGKAVLDPEGNSESAEGAALRGELQAGLALARLGGGKGVLDALKDQIEELQARFGSESGNSRIAWQALNEALELDAASEKVRRKERAKFMKREKDPLLRQEWESLQQAKP
jgi:hypothetical protein